MEARQKMQFEYRPAELPDLERLWAYNIGSNPGDARWIRWRDEAIKNNLQGRTRTFAVCCNGEPVGEGTLIFDNSCSAIRGRLRLADDRRIANVNALRIQKRYEGQGHISKLMREMEQYAGARDFEYLTIGVEAKETRNLAIYLHWGYREFVLSETEDGEPVLYYKKRLL